MRNETCAVRIVICAMRKNFTMRTLSRTAHARNARARRLSAAHEGPNFDVNDKSVKNFLTYVIAKMVFPTFISMLPTHKKKMN